MCQIGVKFKMCCVYGVGAMRCAQQNRSFSSTFPLFTYVCPCLCACVCSNSFRCMPYPQFTPSVFFTIPSCAGCCALCVATHMQKNTHISIETLYIGFSRL